MLWYSLESPQGDSNEYHNICFCWKTRKPPNCIIDCFFLNNEESASCLSCMWNIYWSSSSSLPNMKAIHWRIKVTCNFEKRLTKRLTWCNAWCLPAQPDIAILKDGLKNPSNKKKFNTFRLKKKLPYPALCKEEHLCLGQVLEAKTQDSLSIHAVTIKDSVYRRQVTGISGKWLIFNIPVNNVLVMRQCLWIWRTCTRPESNNVHLYSDPT